MRLRPPQAQAQAHEIEIFVSIFGFASHFIIMADFVESHAVVLKEGNLLRLGN